ncbi:MULTISPECIES: M23 family metallopeptidase [Pseudomonadaceae]|uniref:M23 family metallopeptidase n=1 Tax=Pseudomonas denitrificans TaxID=43306 RepID=A0A9X7N5S0_PSEDE|nr:MULTISPECIES: M23 family metallopeptidase [Pseudomonadaceae]OQR34570.1 peptidase M23 [Pseudomonas sp. T]MBD9513436.1 M23 family metallopeptidase [Pseudomonas sp. PDM22]MBD9632091.1 M23 family metallopeptidase [Pseudomonas sp. PDM19]MBD9682700.1 M23 family metallopeptidase [Pseudomonas sp. PDM20]QEY75584.1 M23 family metallopeptidase [Pseudomonas denitrificans (nom. rej.)]
MKSLSPSRQALTRSDLRLVDPRRIVVIGGCVAVLFAVAAFAGGIWVGRVNLAPAPMPVAAPAEPAAEDDSGERFAAERIGDLAGRLQVLEKDATYLLQAVDSHEEIARKLAKVDPELVPKPKAAAKVAASGKGEGGILLPPRPCAEPLPGSTDDLQQGERSAKCLRRVFDLLMDQVARRNADFMAIPARRPVEQARLGSPFGNRFDPFNHHLAFHSGQDFSAPTGSPIHAAAGGRVIVAGPNPSYGNRVEIDHGNGLVTRYAHASKLEVKVGDVVLPGQEIAKVGSTGRSTGPHLHFEVLYHGEFVDPQNFLSLGGMEIDSDGMATD